MSYKLFCLSLFLLILSKNALVSSDHPLARAEAVITSEASPSSMVNGTVNAIEGSFSFSGLDLYVPGQEPLHVTHHYSSKSCYDSWLGIGMSLNYSFWMVGTTPYDESNSSYSHLSAEASGGSVIRCLGKESGNTYYLDPHIIYNGLTNCGSGELSGKTNLKNTYIKENVNSHNLHSWTSYLSDGSVKVYHRTYEKNEGKNVKYEIRPNKSRLEYVYHSDRSPKKIIAKHGRTLNWLEFDKKHHEATISTSNGKRVTYKYLDNGSKKYVSEIHSSDMPTQKFDYAKAGSYYQINRISWPKGRFLEVEYDDEARVTCQKAPVGKKGAKCTICSFSYHPEDGYTKVLDAYGRKKIYRHYHKRLTAIEQYRRNNKLYRINAFYWGKRKGLSWGVHPKTNEGNLLAEALLDRDKRAHYARCFTYDSYGNVTKEIIYGNLSGHGKRRFRLFPANGRPKDPKTYRYTLFTKYDHKGRLFKKNNALNQWSVHTYDENSNNVFEKRYGAGYWVDYKYDKTNRLISETEYHDKDTPIKTTYSYAFHLISSTDPMGITTHYNYDQAGRKIEEWTSSQDNYSKTTFEYDALGRVSCRKIFYGKEINTSIATHTSYDLLNRIIIEKEVDRQDQPTSWTYYEYDLLGNGTTKRWGIDDNKEAEIKTLYNSKSEATRITDEHGNHTHIAIDHTFKNFYNKQTPRKISIDPLGNAAEEYFDTNGRLISVLKKNRDNKLIAISDFAYNGTGQKIKQIEKVIIDGEIDHDYIITWKLDALDRVTKLTEQPGSPEEKVTRYTYDKSGRLLTLTKPDGVVLSHTYDALGRLISLSSSDGTVSYAYTYDLHNNPLEIRDEVRGFITERTYDAWNRLLSDGLKDYFTQTLTYDAIGRLTSLTAPDGSSVDYAYEHTHLKTINRMSSTPYTHTYDQFDFKDHVLQSTLIGTIGKLQFTWDKKGRTTKIVSPYFTQEIPDGGFDAVGNVIKHFTLDPIGEIHSEASYDELHQLIEEKGVQEHSYKNDSLSNRIKKDIQDYYIDDINRLITDSVQDYVYDKNGNMIQKREGDKTIYYSYDALDRLVEVVDGSRITMYVYDYLHRRIVRTTNRDDPEYFLYLGCREIGLFNPKTNAMREYRVLGLGKGAEIGASIAIELDQEVYCPIHDYRGNIVCLVNFATGEVEESYRYTGYGECEIYNIHKQLINKSSIDNPWGFSSKRIDHETGFIYFHRRYYSPAIGRWVTPDPLGFADGPNLYAYVHNNPLTHFDLYGLYDYNADDDCYNFFVERCVMHLAIILAKDLWNTGQEIVEVTCHPLDKSQEYWDTAVNMYDGIRSLDGEQIARLKDVAIEKFNEDPSRALAEVASYLVPSPAKIGKAEKVIASVKTTEAVQDLAKAGKALTSSAKNASSTVDKVAQNALAGNKIGKVARQKKRAPLPDDPSKLLEHGYHDITHPDAAKKGHRTFENPETNDTIGFDHKKEGSPGHSGRDHYHHYNSNKTSKMDHYLDKDGNPCAKGSEASHLYPGD